MQRGDDELVACGVRLHDAEVADQQCGPGGADAQVAALAPGGPVPEGSEKVQFLHKGAGMLAHDDIDPATGSGNLRGSARAGQPNGGTAVIADHGAVQVAVAIHLRAAQEAYGNAAAL